MVYWRLRLRLIGLDVYRYSASAQYAMIPFLWNGSKTMCLVANCDSYMAKNHLTEATGSRVVSRQVNVHHIVANGL